MHELEFDLRFNSLFEERKKITDGNNIISVIPKEARMKESVYLWADCLFSLRSNRNDESKLAINSINFHEVTNKKTKT